VCKMIKMAPTRDQRSSALRTPEEMLPLGAPKEEFGRMIFEKNLPWRTFSLLLHTTCVRSCCIWRASCLATKHTRRLKKRTILKCVLLGCIKPILGNRYGPGVSSESYQQTSDNKLRFAGTSHSP